jgi:hypothetical protein
MTQTPPITLAATQFYESTVYDRDGDDGFTFITLPRRALSDELSEVVLEKGIPSHAYIFVLFLDPTESEPVKALDADSLLGLVDMARGVTGHDNFTQYLVNEAIIPFEASPLQTKSLVEITSTAGATAALGYFASEHPLILVTLPAGIIICGAALGVSEALQRGLRVKLLKLMGIRDPSEPRDKDLLRAMRAISFSAQALLEKHEGTADAASDETDEDDKAEPPNLMV